jgi:hypothetical protein
MPLIYTFYHGIGIFLYLYNDMFISSNFNDDPIPKKIFRFYHNHPIYGILSMLLILQGLDNSFQKGD